MLFISKSIDANTTTINNNPLTQLSPNCARVVCDASVKHVFVLIYRMLHGLIYVIIIKNKIIVIFLTDTVY